MRCSERSIEDSLSQVLLGQGSSIGTPDKAGHTPLHCAAAGELHTRQLLHVNLDEHKSLEPDIRPLTGLKVLDLWHMQGVKQVQ